MADLFDDKNLFGDSFDLLQSGENNLFADDASKKQTAGTPPTAQKVETKPVDNVNQSFGFDDNLFANSDVFRGNAVFADQKVMLSIMFRPTMGCRACKRYLSCATSLV